MSEVRIKMVLKSSKSMYYASAIYNDGKVIVEKGSRINRKVVSYFTLSPYLVELRNSREIVDSEGVMLQECIFNSPSTAAQFVTGASVNGLLRWRVNGFNNLKEYLITIKQGGE